MANEKYLIIGIGQLGQCLIDSLLEADKEIMVIDSNEEKIHSIQDRVRNALVLDATKSEVLQKLDLETFDAAIVTMGEKFQNVLLISVLLKEAGVKKVIARASSKLEEKILKKVGVDLVIFPELEMGEKLSNTLLRKNVEEAIPLTNGNSIIQVKAPDILIGKTLIDSKFRKTYDINIIAIKTIEKNKEETIIPDAEYIFREKDILIIIGNNKNI
ncbi:MAG: TrkA family potassium uptake protein, partial [Spirochaetes bacterium]|nr:TrkA family potassium uptake protein [Spirochaetota bacterium]